MARKQLEPWGGEVHLPRWLLRRRKPESGDTPEKLEEGDRSQDADRSVLGNTDKAMIAQGVGGWHDLPGQKHYRRKP
jgi:hypothetical protein